MRHNGANKKNPRSLTELYGSKTCIRTCSKRGDTCSGSMRAFSTSVRQPVTFGDNKIRDPLREGAAQAVDVQSLIDLSDDCLIRRTTRDTGHLFMHVGQRPSKLRGEDRDSSQRPRKLRGGPPRGPSKPAWSSKSISAYSRLSDSDRSEFLLYFYFDEVSGQNQRPKKPRRLQSPCTLPEGR